MIKWFSRFVGLIEIFFGLNLIRMAPNFVFILLGIFFTSIGFLVFSTGINIMVRNFKLPGESSSLTMKSRFFTKETLVFGLIGLFIIAAQVPGIFVTRNKALNKNSLKLDVYNLQDADNKAKDAVNSTRSFRLESTSAAIVPDKVILTIESVEESGKDIILTGKLKNNSNYDVGGSATNFYLKDSKNKDYPLSSSDYSLFAKWTPPGKTDDFKITFRNIDLNNKPFTLNGTFITFAVKDFNVKVSIPIKY